MTFIEVVYFINFLILVYFGLLTIGYTTLLIASLPDVWNKFKEGEYGNLSSLITQSEMPPITVLTPMFNEKTRVFNCILSVMKSDAKMVEMIVISDGSTDNTIELLKEKFSLYEVPAVIKETLKTSKIRHCYKSRIYSNLMVIDKEHGHSADTLNVGINACRTPLFLTFDADTVMEPQALTRILFTLLSYTHCVSVGGAVYVINENKVVEGELQESKIPKRLVPAFQTIEYLRSFLYGRSGWNTFGGALCYAGAFTLFEKQIVIEAGGFDVGNFSYDAEITVKLHDYMRTKKYPYRVHYTPNAFAWTEVPNTIKQYWSQRNKWQRGLLRSFLAHKRMFFNPRYGVVGLFSYPFYFFFEIFGPVIEFFSMIFLIMGLFFDFIALEPLLWALLLAWGYIAFISIATIFLNMVTFNRYGKILDSFRTIFLVFVEMLGFRQIRAACCFFGSVQYFIKRWSNKPC